MDIITRLREPSTWASIAAALAALGFSIDDEVWTAICLSGTAIATVLGIVLGEKGKLDGQALSDVARLVEHATDAKRGTATE